MKHFLLPTLLLSLLLPLLSTTALAAQPDQANAIHQAAMTALQLRAQDLLNTVSGRYYDVTLKPLPGNLQTRVCSKPLTINFLSDAEAGPQRFQVVCTSEVPWSIYMKGNIDLFAAVLVSRRPLKKGEIPQTRDFILQEENISELRRGYLTRYDQLDQQQVASRIKAGEIITPSMLRAEQIIKRGDRVTITAQGNSASGQNRFQISMPGEAMSTGTLNQQIRVRNLSSGKILKGTVISHREILVQ